MYVCMRVPVYEYYPLSPHMASSLQIYLFYFSQLLMISYIFHGIIIIMLCLFLI
jgi:hypothetical protein